MKTKAAQYISNFSKTSTHKSFFKLPTWMINLIDDYSFWKQCKKNPLHHNLNYKRGFHKPVKNIDKIIEKIIIENHKENS